MVLNEFVYNPGGSANSALINLVQGSITFLAGEVAHTGDMKVGTPVATMGIRGTAVQVDIDVNNGQIEDVGAGRAERPAHRGRISTAGSLVGAAAWHRQRRQHAPLRLHSARPAEASSSRNRQGRGDAADDLSIVQKVVQTQSVGEAILAQQPLTHSNPAFRRDPDHHVVPDRHLDDQDRGSLTTTGRVRLHNHRRPYRSPPPGAPRHRSRLFSGDRPAIFHRAVRGASNRRSELARGHALELSGSARTPSPIRTAPSDA